MRDYEMEGNSRFYILAMASKPAKVAEILSHQYRVRAASTLNAVNCASRLQSFHPPRTKLMAPTLNHDRARANWSLQCFQATGGAEHLSHRD